MAKRANFILDFSLVVWFADTKPKSGLDPNRAWPGGESLAPKIILLGIIRPEGVPDEACNKQSVPFLRLRSR